jgi:hypothetical protein
MADLNSTIVAGLTARYAKLVGDVRELAAPLNDEQFWKKPFAFGNSFGHLVLHLTGNLNYYIGAQIAGTGYVRDRPLEFSDATRPPKAEVLKKFDLAIEMVIGAINSQSAEDWSKEYTGGRGRARPVRCATAMRNASASSHWADDVSGIRVEA